MVFQARINTKLRAYICYLRRESSVSYREIARRCGISPSSAMRICQEGFSSQLTKKRTGRPPLMTKKVKARFIRTFRKMRDENPNVRVEDVAKDCEITSISYRTLIHTLNDAGYHFLRSRKKGILSPNDRQRRVRYAKTALKYYDTHFWTDDVHLYLDGVSFRHNHKPYEDALCANGKVWRKSNEGLKYTSKGSKNLPGGRSLHLLVGISHSTGVVLAEEYEKMNGPWFAKFVQATLQKVLMDCAVLKGKEKLLLVMDNDPSQRIMVAKDALQGIAAELVEIQARSPDLNPIENIFHNIKRSLREDALKRKIIREDFESFKQRVLSTLLQYDGSVIDRTIETMTLRLQRSAKSGGYRATY